MYNAWIFRGLEPLYGILYEATAAMGYMYHWFINNLFINYLK